MKLETSFNTDFLLRFAVAVILLAHSIPSFTTGSVNEFGNEYLRSVGFGDFGLPLAWIIKLSHIVCAVCLLLNKWLFWPIVVTLLVLIVGLFLVHLPNGWYVVGGGSEGVEFNFLLIFVLMFIMLNNFKK